VTGRTLTRALVAAVIVLAAVAVWLTADAIDRPEPSPTGTTAPRSVP